MTIATGTIRLDVKKEKKLQPPFLLPVLEEILFLSQHKVVAVRECVLMKGAVSGVLSTVMVSQWLCWGVKGERCLSAAVKNLPRWRGAAVE